jgi:oligosaccharide repeat unit polymerase
MKKNFQPFTIAIVLLFGILSGYISNNLSLENVLVILVFTLCLSVIFFSWKVHGNFLSPPVILAVGWLLPALITLVPYSNDFPWRLEPITWFAIFISYFTFLMGYLTVLFYAPGTLVNPKRWGKSAALIIWDKHYYRKSLKLIFTLAFVGFSLNLANVALTVGLGAYFTLGFREIEYIFAFSPATNYLYFLNIIVVVLSALYIRLYGAQLLVILFLIISFATLFFHGIRGTVTFPLFITMYAIFLVAMKVKIRYALLVASIAVLSFFWIVIGREGFSLEQSNNIWQSLDPTLIQKYVAPNYKNLELELQLREQFYYGLMILTPLFKIITYNHFVPAQDISFYLQNPDFNVGTYLRDFYIDFGWFGVLIVPFLLGVVTTFLYGKVLIRPTLLAIILYAVLATVLTFTFWYNELGRIQFWWIIIVVWIADKFAPKVRYEK